MGCPPSRVLNLDAPHLPACLPKDGSASTLVASWESQSFVAVCCAHRRASLQGSRSGACANGQGDATRHCCEGTEAAKQGPAPSSAGCLQPAGPKREGEGGATKSSWI